MARFAVGMPGVTNVNATEISMWDGAGHGAQALVSDTH